MEDCLLISSISPDGGTISQVGERRILPYTNQLFPTLQKLHRIRLFGRYFAAKRLVGVTQSQDLERVPGSNS